MLTRIDEMIEYSLFRIFKGNNFIRLSINDSNFDIPSHDPESAAKELEQALNSLMEGK